MAAQPMRTNRKPTFAQIILIFGVTTLAYNSVILSIQFALGTAGTTGTDVLDLRTALRSPATARTRDPNNHKGVDADTDGRPYPVPQKPDSQQEEHSGPTRAGSYFCLAQ